jgi:hypothetical protein
VRVLALVQSLCERFAPQTWAARNPGSPANGADINANGVPSFIQPEIHLGFIQPPNLTGWPFG